MNDPAFFSLAWFKSWFIKPVPPTLDDIRKRDLVKALHDLHEAHHQMEYYVHCINMLEMRIKRLEEQV